MPPDQKKGERFGRVSQETLTVRVPEKLKDECIRLAESEGASLAEIYRRAIVFYLRYAGDPEAFEKEQREKIRRELMSDPSFLTALRDLLKD